MQRRRDVRVRPALALRVVQRVLHLQRRLQLRPRLAQLALRQQHFLAAHVELLELENLQRIREA